MKREFSAGGIVLKRFAFSQSEKLAKADPAPTAETGMNLTKAILYLFLIFVLAFLLAFFWRSNFLLFTILVISSLSIRQFDWQREDLMRYIIPAIIGPLFEIIATAGGTWSYNNPTFLRIPIWLPLAYGVVAVLVGRLLDNLKKK